MKIKNLNELFVSELRHALNGEKQIIKALPKMASNASSEELRDALEDHLDETKDQVVRLEEIFGKLDQRASGATSDAMKGLLAEGSDLVSKIDDPALRDAGIIAAAQKVEHEEIACYGCLVSWAEQLGMSEAANLLRQTLAEEKAADHKLTEIAKRGVNTAARHEEPAQVGSQEFQSTAI